MNCRALPDLAPGFHATAVELRNVFHDGQAETGTANVVVRARFIGAVETLENTWQIFFADTDAVVAHTQHDFIVALPGGQPYVAAFTRIFDRVIEQIVESFLEPHSVRPNGGQVRRNIDNHTQLLGCQLLFPITTHFTE